MISGSEMGIKGLHIEGEERENDKTQQQKQSSHTQFSLHLWFHLTLVSREYISKLNRDGTNIY